MDNSNNRICPKFWNNKTVLLTGHTGFKGSWLALWLKHLGANVIGYSLPPATTPNMFTECGIANDMISIFGDIRDKENFQSIFKKYSPEIIFHLAAQPLVLASYEDPIDTYSTNVMGTLNLFECARHADNTQVIINITSDKCYENKEWVWAYRENEPMGGHDPYSSSKACAEILTSSYRRSYFVNASNIALISARAGNCIGGGDWSFNRLIPDVMRAFLAKEKVIIRSPNSIRPWQHVLEPLYGYLLLAQNAWADRKTFSEAWNFGPNFDACQPVIEIMSSFKEILGNDFKFAIDENFQHQHEASFLRVDNSKAQQQLGWHPRFNLTKALGMTSDWYLNHKLNHNMEAYTLMQINFFQQLVEYNITNLESMGS